MRASNFFFAAIFLIAVGTMILFGITVMSPENGGRKDVSNDIISATPLDAPSVDFGNPARGAATPELTIVEFGDHRCEPCAATERDLTKIIADFPDKIRVVWKDFPNEQSHPDAIASAKAARCAGAQGAFWPYHEALMSNQSATGIENYVVLASNLGLDAESFRSCATSDAMRPSILRDSEEALRLRIDATPYVFIGDHRISGAVGYDLLKTYVESALGTLQKVPETPQAAQ